MLRGEVVCVRVGDVNYAGTNDKSQICGEGLLMMPQHLSKERCRQSSCWLLCVHLIGVGISKWSPIFSNVGEKHTTFCTFGNMKDAMFSAAWLTRAPSRIAANNEFPLTPYSTDRH